MFPRVSSSVLSLSIYPFLSHIYDSSREKLVPRVRAPAAVDKRTHTSRGRAAEHRATSTNVLLYVYRCQLAIFHVPKNYATRLFGGFECVEPVIGIFAKTRATTLIYPAIFIIETCRIISINSEIPSRSYLAHTSA